MPSSPEPQAANRLYSWLLTCCGFVFIMVLIGAITRLTESGLSMTEWRPLIGWIPPLSEAEWQRVFDLYRQSPEYKHKHYWMEMGDFKQIFFWEWLHRLWGRLVGLVYTLPLIWFWVTKQIPAGWGKIFIGLLALGAAQGVLGWYMVQSGLIDRPAVSHFRLAAHLGLAFIIYAALLWTARTIKPPRPKIHESRPASTRLLSHGWATFAFVGITIIWGAFVAGLDAGLLYNSFPLMGEGLIPPELKQSPSVPYAITHEPASVQFTHRILGITAVLAVLSFWWHMQRAGQCDGWCHALMAMILAQVGIGIATLLSGVNIAIATAHQAGALILLTLLVVIMHQLHRAGKSAAYIRASSISA